MPRKSKRRFFGKGNKNKSSKSNCNASTQQQEPHESDSEDAGKEEDGASGECGTSLVSRDSAAAMGQVASEINSDANVSGGSDAVAPKEATITLKVIQFIGELPRETRGTESVAADSAEDNKSITEPLLHSDVGDVPKLDHNSKKETADEADKRHQRSFDDNYRVESPKQICNEGTHSKRHAMLIQEISESSSSEEVKQFLDSEAKALELKNDKKNYRVESPESSDDNNNTNKVAGKAIQNDVTVFEISESSSAESVGKEILALEESTPSLKIINIKELPTESSSPLSSVTNVSSPSKINTAQFECKTEKKLNKAEEAILEALYGNKSLLQKPNLPLDVISEEGSECGSDVVMKLNTGSDELDDDVFLPPLEELSKKNPKPCRKLHVAEQPLLISTKIIETEANIPEGFNSWETSQGDTELEAELVYLTSASSSATDLSERGDLTDNENAADDDSSESTETNSLLENIEPDMPIEMKFSQVSAFYQEVNEQKLPDIIEEDEDQSRSIEAADGGGDASEATDDDFDVFSEQQRNVSVIQEKVDEIKIISETPEKIEHIELVLDTPEKIELIELAAKTELIFDVHEQQAEDQKVEEAKNEFEDSLQREIVCDINHLEIMMQRLSFELSNPTIIEDCSSFGETSVEPVAHSTFSLEDSVTQVTLVTTGQNLNTNEILEKPRETLCRDIVKSLENSGQPETLGKKVTAEESQKHQDNSIETDSERVDHESFHLEIGHQNEKRYDQVDEVTENSLLEQTKTNEPPKPPERRQKFHDFSNNQPDNISNSNEENKKVPTTPTKIDRKLSSSKTEEIPKIIRKNPQMLQEDIANIISTQKLIENLNRELRELSEEHEGKSFRATESKLPKKNVELSENVPETINVDISRDKKKIPSDNDNSNRVTPTFPSFKRKNSSDSSSSANSQCTIIRQIAPIDPLRDLCMQSLKQNGFTLEAASDNKDMMKITIHRKLNSSSRNAPQIPIMDELELHYECDNDESTRVITILQVPPDMNSAASSTDKDRCWMGLPSSQVPNLMVALSPRQKEFMDSRESTNASADVLLDMHKKFVERRAYHEVVASESSDIVENSNNEDGYCADRENSVENSIECDNDNPTSPAWGDILNCMVREDEFLKRPFSQQDAPDPIHLAESFEAKKFELENELKKMDNERQELEEELKNLQSLQHFKREEFLYNERKFRENMKKEIVEERQKYANDDFNEFVYSNEKLQRELYDEWQSKVLERHERKLQKTLKITSISDAISQDEPVTSDVLKAIPLENEFMTKLKERQKRLSLTNETEVNSSTESLHHQNEESKKSDKDHKTANIPAHLYEFIKYYEEELIQNKNSDESGELKRVNPLLIGLIGVSMCLCGFYIGKYLTQR